MYQTLPTTQTPYLSNPNNQPDFIDQATKILNFVDYLQNRQNNSSKNIDSAPNYYGAPSNYAIGNFAAQNQQKIAEQELRLQNLNNSAQQDLKNLIEGFKAAIQERDLAMQALNNALPFVKSSQIYLNIIDRLIKESDLSWKIAQQIPYWISAAKNWAAISNMENQVLENSLQLFSDPQFLLYWCLSILEGSIHADSRIEMSILAEGFLNLLEKYKYTYKIKYQQDLPINPINEKIGNTYTYAPPIPPMPPIPGIERNTDPISALKQKIELLKSNNPNLGLALQRIHANQRQQFNDIPYI